MGFSFPSNTKSFVEIAIPYWTISISEAGNI